MYNVFNLISSLKFIKKEKLIITDLDEFVMYDTYKEYMINRWFKYKLFRKVVIDFSINDMRPIDEASLIIAEKIIKEYGNRS
jgi:hypothetical protein